MIDDTLTLALVRGDHQLNEQKLADATGAVTLRPAAADEIHAVLSGLPAEGETADLLKEALRRLASGV